MLAIYTLCGGYIDLGRHEMIPDGPVQRWTVPVPCFLIVHPKGRFLFDTGVHPASIADPVGRLGPERAKRLGIRSQPGDDVASGLSRLGLTPADITLVANSHLHFDHCGGNALFPRATVMVQKAELDAARSPEVLATGRYKPSELDWNVPVSYRTLEGEHDVFGDGSVLLIPTFGHTPGHQSLVLRMGKGATVALTADACYTQENMDRDILPTIVWDTEEMSRSLGSLRRLRDAQGARVFFGHDPAQWAATPQAPAAFI